MNDNDAERLQDAIYEVKDKEIEGPPKNSWVTMAMNPARSKKIKEGKDEKYRGYQRYTMVAACILLAVCLIVPRLMPKEESDTEKEESNSNYVTDEAAEVIEAKEAVSEGNSSGSDNTGEGEALVLTAGEWNDNSNWPFFSNLVNSGTIDFPSYGIDPRNRIRVTVTDEGETPQAYQKVLLTDADNNSLWAAVTNKDGIAYLFYENGQDPFSVYSNGVTMDLVVNAPAEDQQGDPVMERIDDITVRVPEDDLQDDGNAAGIQIMFIVDTTGSMGDELAYLQKDFASIAESTFDSDTYYSVNFYRDEGDEYVTKTNGFTQNLATVQNQLNEEYAAGGGDLPEAVSEILRETILDNGEWDDNCAKVAFLIFDAPPHDGTDEVVSKAAKFAAEKGIHIVPVVASNADRNTELFGRALAIVTDGTYVFLTDDSGVGETHLEPIVGAYEVELLHDIIVRIITSYK